MTRVGIISDTHGLLRPEVLETLKSCDYILHAGDVTDERLLDRIRFLGRLYVVRGNNDGSWAGNIARRLRFRIEDLEFCMVHDRRDAGPEALEANIVVYGHSHIYSEQMIDGRLWFNPGSCGFPRFGGGVTFAVMEINGKDYQIHKIVIH